MIVCLPISKGPKYLNVEYVGFLSEEPQLWFWVDLLGLLGPLRNLKGLTTILEVQVTSLEVTALFHASSTGPFVPVPNS